MCGWAAEAAGLDGQQRHVPAAAAAAAVQQQVTVSMPSSTGGAGEVGSSCGARIGQAAGGVCAATAAAAAEGLRQQG
jgi:hypothetical protein